MTYLDVWRSGTFLLYKETSPRVSDVERSVTLQSMIAIGSALAYLLFFRECATPPHIPGTSYHVTQFYQAFPRVSTASNIRWGEKAWVRGYLSIHVAIQNPGKNARLAQ